MQYSEVTIWEMACLKVIGCITSISYDRHDPVVISVRKKVKRITCHFRVSYQAVKLKKL